MTLNQRRVLYIIFILAFIVITPLISLYAAGYKLGSGLTLEKTGTLIVDSKPHGAKIYINGQLQQNFFTRFFNQSASNQTTPAKIKNILPGDYTIRIELEGYQSWEKKLTITSGESTYAEDINLFKTGIPIIIENGSRKIIGYSPDKKFLASLEGNEAVLLDLEKETVQTARLSTSTVEDVASSTQVAWSPDKSRLLWGSVIFDKNDWPDIRPLQAELGEGTSRYSWDNTDNNLVYFLRSDTLYRYNLNTKVIEAVLSATGIGDYRIGSGAVYYTSESDRKTMLSVWQNGTITENIDLPLSDYRFLDSGGQVLNLYDDTYRILYLIDPGNPIKPIRDSINNITVLQWLDSSRLLYANDFEVWLYDFSSFNRTLLTRISEPITDIMWHPSKNYAIFTTATNIFTLELDNRDKYNITKLASLDNISNPILSEDGTKLYFYAQIGRQTGVYKLVIQ